MAPNEQYSTPEGIKGLLEKASENVWLAYTPVAGHSDPDVMKIFTSGDGIRVTDIEGNSALSIARHMGHAKIVAHLKMAGAEDASQYLDVADLNRSFD